MTPLATVLRSHLVIAALVGVAMAPDGPTAAFARLIRAGMLTPATVAQLRSSGLSASALLRVSSRLRGLRR